MRRLAPSGRVLALLAGAMAYVVVYSLLSPVIGAGATSASALLAATAGFALGRRRGAAFAVGIVALNLALKVALAPHEPPAPSDTFYGGLVILLALVGGQMRATRSRLKTALAEISDSAKALEKSEQLLQRTQELANMGSWRVVPGKDVVDCTPHMRVMLGLGPGTTLALHEAAGLLAPRDLTRLQATVRASMGTGKSLTTTVQLTPADGRARSLLLYIQPEETGIVGLAQDITEQLQTDEVLSRSERLSALGTLVAGVAHEINNPLSFMRGNIELAQMDLDEAEKDPSHAERAFPRVRESQVTVLRGIDRIAAITQSSSSSLAPPKRHATQLTSTNSPARSRPSRGRKAATVCSWTCRRALRRPCMEARPSYPRSS